MHKSPADNLDILSLVAFNLHTDLVNTLSLFADAMPLGAAHFGPGTEPIHIGSASCNGSEQRIVDCQLRYENGCVHSEDAGVNCSCKESLVF